MIRFECFLLKVFIDGVYFAFEFSDHQLLIKLIGVLFRLLIPFDISFKRLFLQVLKALLISQTIAMIHSDVLSIEILS